MQAEHPIRWVAAAPLWNALAQDPVRMQRPALLRFNSDSFMEDLAGLLERDAQSLSDKVAAPRSFGGGAFGADDPGQPLPQGASLKLYQPIHGDFNLIAASLVCQTTGLPDRTVNTARSETIGFVVRRLGDQGEEMAWIVDADQIKSWQSLRPDQFAGTLKGEELLPLFPVNYSEGGRRRRLLVGLVPTSSREAYHSAARLAPPNAEGDSRLDELNVRVIDPLTAMIDASLPSADLELQASRFILVDLAQFLEKNNRDVWNAINDGPEPGLGSDSQTLFRLLRETHVSGRTTWQQALQVAGKERDLIQSGQDQQSTLQFSLKSTDRSFVVDLRKAAKQAIGPPPAQFETGTQLPAVSQIDPGAETLYVLRCVYQRPRCGALHDDVVGSPSEPFALAPFFDSDAPSRPIRIALPVDTSIAGLRKFSRNVGFVISKKLRQQMNSVSDLKEVLKGNIASGPSFELGEICSFSIPIITICAMLVLMIFIILLNIVFWWLPFVRICFPIPKPKGS